MGNVRTRGIKVIARKLLSSYPDLFKPDFEYNKKLVAQLVNTRSKKVRNQIAGYITHLIRIQEKLKRSLETQSIETSQPPSGEA
ncbi:MAG: 30S ribosomal protein S17e [Desulfurococcales archaeon]|jgi:small subunit ribosomal protein S17e|nr:30S ribosomal protein S17e [Desulfurococcales archaeon]MCC6061756.1 30S ribosomal protein S17e [Desulfurococcales archaeon]MCI4457725.1 30S ribosomal protein S17e [Desulfurococcaceae archaeon]